VLVKLSRFYGSDPEFVLAGGGNTSVKVGDRLFVKGSGHALATIPAEGFVEMDRKQLAALLNSTLSRIGCNARRSSKPPRSRRASTRKRISVRALRPCCIT
jgi:hypothetical protein